ncbi:hypothetical protein C8F01DRAFT_987412 [Mycena amicta]|nr:hypothetical protein C8F01DRAFT_987412 [Mycena amicta]
MPSLNSPFSFASSSTPSLTPSSSPTPKRAAPIPPHASASLGRSTAANLPPASTSASGTTHTRRNSLNLGDLHLHSKLQLKIPARISQAQQGLRRDLSMVKEFARGVEELKDLQATYQALVIEIERLLRLDTRTHEYKYKQLAAAFYTIKSTYRISWECAELLIELGGGPPTMHTSESAPAMTTQRRERATTLIDNCEGRTSPLESSSSTNPIAPNSAWRASTGRSGNDLSQRQLRLLREMLRSPTPPADESVTAREVMVNRDWRWGGGDAMNSTVTLPSEEEDSGLGGIGLEKGKGKKGSRLRGMSGIRDMLRALKKGTASASLSTVESSSDQHLYEHGQVSTHGRRRAKTSTGPESIRSTHRPTTPSPPGPVASLKTKTASDSPRRPSLASIFRIGKSHRTPPSSPRASPLPEPPVDGTSDDADEDWDRLVESDIEPATTANGPGQRDGGTSTIRGRSPYSFRVPGRPAMTGSRGSLHDNPSEGTPSRTRSTRLSSVEELPDQSVKLPPGIPSRQSSSHLHKTASVRSLVPPPLLSQSTTSVAMMPENIKPLLENTREVHARLTECISDVRALLATCRLR